VRPPMPRLAQYWKAILSACSTATAPSAANRKWGASTGSSGASASANSTTTVLPFPSMVLWATLPTWATNAASSSGTRCPKVLTHNDEMASR
jgi:hypothetical protein